MVVPADWKEFRLGDLGSTFGGLTGKSSGDFGEGNSRFVTFMNVMSNVVLNIQGTEKVRIANGERQSQVLEGDVIFNGSSETPEEVGFGSAVPIEISGLYLNSFCFGFRRKDTKSLDPRFFAYLTRSPLGRDIIRPMAQGSTRYNIAKTNLLNGRFPLPPLKEQEVIAETLSDADAAIESLDALIAKKRDVKQATMQQLLTGRTRLPGFNADWKEVRLGDLGPLSKGVGIRKNEVTPYGVPCVRYGQIYTDYNFVIGEIQTFVSPQVAGNSRRLRKGEILFAGSGETKEDIGKCIAYVEDVGAVAGGDIVVLTPEGADSRFLGYSLNSPNVAQQKMSRAQGDAVVHISAANLASIVLDLPPLKEQEAIAEALSVMDDELEALTEQVSKLRMMKEGMMQDLLTGKVRLV